MRMAPHFSIRLRCAIVFLQLALLPGCAAAQEASRLASELFSRVPFDEWVKEGPKEQVPWRTRSAYEGLSGHQRLLASFQVQVSIQELLKRPRNRQLILLLQVTDSAGREFRNFEKLELSEIRASEKAGKNEALRFSWYAFIRPGEYQVATVLYHGGTSEHNLSIKRLKIPAWGKDPLPGAWDDLPPVEFWAPIQEDNLDFFFRPEIAGRLRLPLTTQRPIRLEVLADFTASDVFRGSKTLYSNYLGAALPTLKTFSQIDVRNGTLDVEALDLARQEVTFQQDNLKEIDWARLKQALSGTHPSVVSVDALSDKHPGPKLLRDEVMRRIKSRPASSNEALRVFVLISSPLGLYSFAAVKSELLPERCSCLIYYLEYDASRRPGLFSALGSVRKMLRPAPVRTFSAHSSEGIRKALATIMREVEQKSSAAN